MDEKAQASTEVLILIAGAVVVAIVVGMYLKGAANQIGEEASTAADNI